MKQLPSGLRPEAEAALGPPPTVPGAILDPLDGIASRPSEAGRSIDFRASKGGSKYRPPRPPAPWERQAGEGGREWTAFKAYRDMADRSLAKTAIEIDRRLSVISDWSRRWGWVERVAFWDQEVERAAAKGHLRAVELARERHVNLSLVMQQAVAKRLQGEKFSPESLTNKDVPKWLKVAVDIERAALGLQDGPRVQVNVSQQQAQQQQAQAASAAVTAGERTIAELLEADPSRLRDMLPEIDGILEHVQEPSGE